MGFFIFLAIHIYTSLALQVIAHKTETRYSYLSWTPVLCMFIMPVLIARKPAWWLVPMLTPGVNLVVGIFVWMSIAERLSKPPWTAFILAIPFVNIIALGMYAWTD